MRGLLIWIICYEAKGYISARIDLDDVATDGGGWGVDRCSAVDTSAGCGPLYDLEIVAVYVEGMAACIEVVDYYFDCIVVV